MKNKKTSNIKFRYKDTGSERLMSSFSTEVMNKLRKTSKIVGRKCRKTARTLLYMTLKDSTTVTPTQARDDEGWFKEIYEDCKNKSLPVILIEQVLNRYASYMKRNKSSKKKSSPRYVEFKKNTVNIKKNYFKYDDTKNEITVRNLQNENIKLNIDDHLSVLVHKDVFLNKLKGKLNKPDSALSTVAWAANMMFDHKLIIPTVFLSQEEPYIAKNFFAADINLTRGDWLHFNMPLNGKEHYAKPAHIAAAEDRVAAIQKKIDESLKIAPDQRKYHTVLFEDVTYKATHVGRTRLRKMWHEEHKKLGALVSELPILKEIEEFVIANKLGYAHDNVKTGDRNGTFCQDHLKNHWVGRARNGAFPFEIVPPAYTSQECPECGHRSKENRKGDEFKCTKCKYENQSHKVGAINIGRRAMQIYSLKQEGKDSLPRRVSTKSTDSLEQVRKGS